MVKIASRFIKWIEIRDFMNWLRHELAYAMNCILRCIKVSALPTYLKHHLGDTIMNFKEIQFMIHSINSLSKAKIHAPLGVIHLFIGNADILILHSALLILHLRSIAFCIYKKVFDFRQRPFYIYYKRGMGLIIKSTPKWRMGIKSLRIWWYI